MASRSYNYNDTETTLLKYSYNHIYCDRTQCIFIKNIQSLSQRTNYVLQNYEQLGTSVLRRRPY